MNDFKNIGNIHGVPVYYKQAEDRVRSSAMKLVVLTGTTDDTLVDGGKPGLYHWFEHVPFRGTVKYLGKKNVKTLIAETGGNINAETDSFKTTFSAHVPTRYIELAVDILVDLVSFPLLRKKDIAAEKAIIKEEILESLNDPNIEMRDRIVSEIFKGHPIGSTGLGTAEDLDLVNTKTLRNAHNLGYSTSRMFFVIETSVKKDVVVKMLSKMFECLPSNPHVLARNKVASIKPMVWKPSFNLVISSKMKSSKVVLCLPTTGARVFEDGISTWVANSLLTHGSTQSPLAIEARYKQHLTYGVSMNGFYSPDGGFLSFEAETSEPEKVLEILKTKVLFDKRLFSKVWFETVQKAKLNYKDMRSPNPGDDVRSASNTVARFGEYFTDNYTQEVLKSVTFKDVQRKLEEQRANLKTSRSFIFKAKKK